MWKLHVIMSHAARKVLKLETDLMPEAFTARAFASYAPDDIAAPPASGSWRHDGMIVCPCSMATLSAVATGFGHNLIHRGADVSLKERRRIVLVPRETPLSSIHLENMLTATRAGAVIVPACPGFYHRPATIEDLADQLAARYSINWTFPTTFTRGGETRRLFHGNHLVRPRKFPDQIQ